MNSPNRRGEQVLCIEQEAGAGIHYMDIYDKLRPDERRLLREAPINLCPACYARNFYGYPETRIRKMLEFVEYSHDVGK